MLGTEQLGVAANAAIRAVVFVIHILARKGAFGRGLLGDGILLGIQLVEQGLFV